MAIGDLAVFAALKQKMHWHQARQGLLAENIANAETPGYRGRDLKSFTFSDEMKAASSASLTTSATHTGHFSTQASNTDGFAAQRLRNFEVTPEGNGVTLEDEMMKVTSNQMEYQAATTLYTRSMRLMRTALGR